MRTDPSDTGGLFVGRRPGTAPVHFRKLPERAGAARERVDGSLANLLGIAMTFICLLLWGPIPVGCLWVGSEVNYLTGSVSFGILCAFGAMLALLFGSLSLLKRIDSAWILVRRAAGFDQRGGVLGRIFAGTAAICALAFAIWFLVIHGPGSSTFSGRPGG